MKIYILPNWFKKIGLTFFIVASLLNGSINFLNSSNKLYSIDAPLPGINVNELGIDSASNGFKGLINAFTGGALPYIINILAIIGIFVYIVSREKVEDDFINKLRLESFQLTTIIGLMVATVFYIVAGETKFTLDYFIFPLLWSYLIIFFLKRKLYI